MLDYGKIELFFLAWGKMEGFYGIIIVLLLVVLVVLNVLPYIKKKEDLGEEVTTTPEVKVTKPVVTASSVAKNSDDNLLHMSQVRNGSDPALDWTGVILKTEVSPEVQENHSNFIKDVKNFSSTAGFTNVADDNTNPIYTNFVGLRRPEYVPIDDTVRQTYDINPEVLQRNQNIRWGTKFNHP